MGSRRGRYAALAALALGACSVGAPPGWPEGDRWVVPLVGPLEDGLLLVPALVNNKGPYVFAIDPDAHVSIVDQGVVAEAVTRTGEGPKLLDETDTQQNRFYGEILEWTLGTLTIKGGKPAQIVPLGTFDADGRRIHGVIGRDIIADSLVFSYQRDAGLVMLATQKGAMVPRDAIALTYSTLRSSVQNAETVPAPRKLVTATIGDQRFAMHLDLGATTSQLRPRSWAKARLAESDLALVLVDEVGMKREVKKQGVADVTVGGASTKGVVFVPFSDRRWPEQDIDGTIGLNFFEPYDVVANWDKSTVYLAPRRGVADVIARIGRWQSKTLTSCASAGCVKLSLIDPLAGKSPEEMPAKHPGLVASIVREPSAMQLNLEVLIAVSPAAGKGPLKWLVANLPAGTDRAMTHLPEEYLGATLTVLDASPFPRACPGDGACVDRLAPPFEFAPGPADERQQLPPSAVTLRTGDRNITPGDGGKVAVEQAGAPQLSATVKVCADATGKVERTTLIQPSRLQSYNDKIVRTIQKTWSYEPYVFDGKPIPFCTAVTFIYTQR